MGDGLDIGQLYATLDKCQLQQYIMNIHEVTYHYLSLQIFYSNGKFCCSILKLILSSPSNAFMVNPIFYCEKYTYHFLTIAICWCHPTHWPTLRNVLSYLKKPVSECGSRKPPNGHVTTPIGAIHLFLLAILECGCVLEIFVFCGSFVDLLWIVFVLR